MIEVVRQGDVLWKYDGDVKESLGKIQGETKFEVTVEDFPEGLFSFVITDSHIVIYKDDTLLSIMLYDWLKWEKDFVGFRAGKGLYVFEEFADSITVLDFGFRIKDRKVCGKNKIFPIDGEDTLMPFTGIFWYLIDKYNDDGKFEAPYYFKGKKYNYVYKDNKVYAIEGMPVIGNKILKDGQWKEIPHSVAKRLERKVIEEIPSESLPIVLYDEVFSWINFYQS